MDISEDEHDDDLITEGIKKRKLNKHGLPEYKGRPPTTGDYVRIAEVKERVNKAKGKELELKEREERLQQKLLFGDTDLSIDEKELAQTLKQHPTSDLGQTILAQMEGVKYVAHQKI